MVAKGMAPLTAPANCPWLAETSGSAHRSGCSALSTASPFNYSCFALSPHFWQAAPCRSLF